ncbi:hypothetical protein P4544_00010 [Halomonas sp. LY9]
MNQRIQLASIDDQRNVAAREAVRQRISWPVNLTPANVTYHSRGHVLLLGSALAVSQAASALQGRGLASLTLLTTDAAVELLATSEPLISQVLSARQQAQLNVAGHLGAFRATVTQEDGEVLNLAQALIERDVFDVVLDMAEPEALNVAAWEILLRVTFASLGSARKRSALTSWRA